MNQNSEALLNMKNDFKDPTPGDFNEESKFLPVFTFFKFQLVKLFTFFQNCSKNFSTFSGNESTEKKKGTVEKERY